MSKSAIKLFCPNEIICPYSISSESGIQSLLNEQIIGREGFTLQCSKCNVHVLPCENCGQLVEDITMEKEEDQIKKDDIVKSSQEIQSSSSSHSSQSQSKRRKLNADTFPTAYCASCGFKIPLDSSIRELLKLPNIKPLSFDQVRIVQKSISEQLYLSYKAELYESLHKQLQKIEGEDGKSETTRKDSSQNTNTPVKKTNSLEERNTEELKSALSAVIQQLHVLRNPSISDSDFVKIQEFSFNHRIKNFSLSDFKKVLQALYEDNDKHLQELFSQISNFLENLGEIFKVKKEFNMACTACRVASKRLKHPAPNAVDANSFVLETISFRKSRLSNLLDFYTKPFLKLLDPINKELDSLYNQTAHFSHHLSLLIENSTNALEELQSEHKLSLIRKKVNVWRLLYSTISCIGTQN